MLADLFNPESREGMPPERSPTEHDFPGYGLSGIPQGAAPPLPVWSGKAERRTHEYRRHGTIMASAALNVKAGPLTGDCDHSHSSVGSRAFRDRVARSVRPSVEIQLVLDSLKTHGARLAHGRLAEARILLGSAPHLAGAG